MVTTLASENIEVKFKRMWKTTYHHGWEDWMANPFEKLVDETYQEIRSKLKPSLFTIEFRLQAPDEGACLLERKAPNEN